MMFFIPAEGQLNGKSPISENLYRKRLWDYIMLYFTAKGTNEFGSNVEPQFSGR
jgi:hypothetical protein